jgi:hypothetical protein
MRKRQISPTPPGVAPSGQAWLDVDSTAFVEVTSAENDYPIESVLLGVEHRGWRASNSGTQTIRLIFDEPQNHRENIEAKPGVRWCCGVEGCDYGYDANTKRRLGQDQGRGGAERFHAV